MEGWPMASKGLRPLPRRRGSALAHGCGRDGRGVLPLARPAAVWTGVRVLDEELRRVARGRAARAPDGRLELALVAGEVAHLGEG